MIEEACAVADRLGLQGPVMEQPKYNLLSREIVEKEYAELYPRIGLTVFSPLAGGILTGKYTGGVIPAGSRQVRWCCSTSDSAARIFALHHH